MTSSIGAPFSLLAFGALWQFSLAGLVLENATGKEG